MMEKVEFRNEKTAPYKNEGSKNQTSMFGIGVMDRHDKLNPSSAHREKVTVLICCCATYNCGGAVTKND